MIKPDDPRQLAIDLLDRSECAVQVAAVIADKHGIFSWGWNSVGASGFGEHAEAAAIRRANKKRLAGSTIYVAGRRKKSKNLLMSAPCPACAVLLEAKQISWVYYTLVTGDWVGEQWR